MAKITSVNNGDTGDVARGKINTAMESIEIGGEFAGDGNVGTELNFLGRIYNAARTFYAFLSTTLLTANRTHTLPDKDGTFAMLDDIPSVLQNKFDAIEAPVATNDNTEGYAVGSTWIDVTNDNAYKCVDASTGAAVWKRIDNAKPVLESFTQTLNYDNRDTYSNIYTQTGVLNFVKGTSTYGYGATNSKLVTTNGDAINFTSDFIVLNNDYSSLTVGNYDVITWLGADAKIRVYIISLAGVASPPEIISENTTGLNAYIEVDFSEGVYTDNGGVNPVLVADFEVYDFVTGGGSATGASISSLEKSGGSGALTGGETTVRFNLSYTGTPSGGETFKIRPVSGSAVYNSSGVAMLSTETTGTITLVAPAVTMLTFQTNSPNTTTFDPVWVMTSGALKWDLGDGTEVETNSVSYTYADGTTKTVTVYQNTTGGDTEVEQINMVDDHIIGTLNLGNFTNLGGATNINTNPGMTGITWPTSSAIFTALDVSNSGLTGTQNISGLIGLGGLIQFNGNSALTGITNPTSSQTISTYFCYDCDITGTLSFAGLSGLSGNVRGYGNSNLTGLTVPTVSNVFTDLRFYNCNLTGNVNISGLTGLGGTVQFFGNSLLTGITNPTSAQSITNYNVQNCDITGTLDVSGLVLSGTFACAGNSNLTGITHGASSGTFSIYWADDCGLTGTLDVSLLTGWGGNVQIDNNPGLTGVTMPSTTQTFINFYADSCALGVINFNNAPNMTDINSCTIRLQNNAMTAAEVDENLVKLDTISSGGFTGRSIVISGTNAAPTDGTVTGFDGLSAKTSLIGKGFTVTTN